MSRQADAFLPLVTLAKRHNGLQCGEGVEGRRRNTRRIKYDVDGSRRPEREVERGLVLEGWITGKVSLQG